MTILENQMNGNHFMLTFQILHRSLPEFLLADDGGRFLALLPPLGILSGAQLMLHVGVWDQDGQLRAVKKDGLRI